MSVAGAGSMAQFMREVSMGVRATRVTISQIDETGRLGEYYRADPLTQKQMTLDIAREYANGALGMNNEYVPYSGAGTPSRNAGSILGFDGDLNEAYRRIELEGGSEAESRPEKRLRAVVRAKQRAVGVVPGGGVGRPFQPREYGPLTGSGKLRTRMRAASSLNRGSGKPTITQAPARPARRSGQMPQAMFPTMPRKSSTK
jgi:hypothetical protein